MDFERVIGAVIRGRFGGQRPSELFRGLASESLKLNHGFITNSLHAGIDSVWIGAGPLPLRCGNPCGDAQNSSEGYLARFSAGLGISACIS